jgi:hypothetical protein
MVPTNLVGNAIATIIVAKSEGALDEERLNAVLDGRLGTLSTEDATAVTRVCNPLSADGLRLALRAAIRVRCTNQDCSSVRQM